MYTNTCLDCDQPITWDDNTSVWHHDANPYNCNDSDVWPKD